ncbi:MULTISPECIES: amidase [unclassified Rhodococcus (in: high G+C Gram-positive bacteria)]|uniref:amidase n=1 Tax=unclassified Rhodococcus (in: high G+C Gram-positive bacteria) TaxID=192944 RepID=UPI0015C5FCF4|nr:MULTISPECIES: amidase [unclassified Rhodococcus (in: high G+C Gram-positive bacteria)]
MSVQKPSSAQIASLAAEIGYTDIAEAPEEFTAMISGMVGVLDALSAIPETEVLRSRDAVNYTVPTVEEDPHHAWEVRTSIPGADSGPLAGVRLGVKDSILVAGVPMRNGSRELETFVPKEDATVVTRVLAAGAEVIGKTTNEYFCMSGGSHTAATGVVHNPHRMGYSSGGSSSGSAVALVTGDADMTLGADQAGSIRMPASWSGVVGLKPTYGLVPYTGIGTLDGYFDHVGPMTRTVVDNARLLTVIAGSDGIDFRQRDIVVGDYSSRIDDGVKGLRIGVLTEGFGTENAEADVDRTVRDTVDSLGRQGAIVEEVSIPLHSLGSALWTAIAIEGMAETVLRNQGFGFGRPDYYPVDMMQHLFDHRGDVDAHPANVRLFTLVGRYVDQQAGRLHYAKAVNSARTLRAAYDDVLERFDVLVTPTTPQTARPLPDPEHGTGAAIAASIEMSTNTTPFNVTHHPALSVPCGTVDGLPVGIQLIGKHFDEAILFRVGQAIENL